jgi:ADP-ribose pyrophosphatase
MLAAIIMNTKLIERLAELEHEQWSAWTRHFLNEGSPENIERWRRQLETPYSQLTEEEKEADRVWARKVLQCTEGKAVDQGSVFEGRFLRVKQKNGWEYVERTNASGIVAILAITTESKVLLIEQFRPPLGKIVVEIPAGLAGDIPGEEHETFAIAAQRELLEETGYQAETMEYLTDGPASAGLSTEMITFFRASGLTKVAAGGGEASEKITVHEVPLYELTGWIARKRQEGCVVDYKVYAALYFEDRLA